MPVFTAGQARATLYRLIDQAADSHEPILIADTRKAAVRVAQED